MYTFWGGWYTILETFPSSLHEVDGIVLQSREYDIEEKFFRTPHSFLR
jgi:hypothetical protein